MSIIPGSIPVTGFIAPTDTSDDYAVTDAIYGIDGLRNVADYTARNNISIERRRAGMVVGTINDGKYWRLKNQAWTLGSSGDWELFLQVGPSGSVVSTGLKYIIESTDDIEVPNYTQYWIYGDLTIYGQMTNYGEVIIADGGLVMSGGTFSNYGTLTFVTINGTASGTASYVNSTTIGFTVTGSTVSAQVITGSLTASHLNTGSNGGATAGYFLSADSVGNFQWIPGSGVGTITGVNAGMGLTGGGVSGTVTLDVNVDNGLSIVNDNVVLGGTLSQNTTIDGNNLGFDFTNIAYLSSYSNFGSIFSQISNNNAGGITIANSNGVVGSDLNFYLDGTTVSDGYTSSIVFNDAIYFKGISYQDDYTVNFTNNSLVTKQYVDTQIAGSSKLTINDKNLVAIDSLGDGDFSGATISGTPIDNSYVTVFINGIEYLVGNGVTNSVDCYFSNTGGSNARGFSSAHPNGRIQANDGLYWNGTITGVNLISGWRISIHYLI